MPHKLVSGQINFENVNHPGSWSCIVIKDGDIHNMTDDLRDLLLKAIDRHDKLKSDEIELEDMFS